MKSLVGRRVDRPPLWLVWIARLFGFDLENLYFDEKSIAYSTHLIGLPGLGKTRWLMWRILELLRLGIAFTFIDPHGDATRDLLKILIHRGFFKNPSAYRKLLVIDWTDREDGAFVPLNVIKWSSEPHVAAAWIRQAMHRMFPGLDELDAVWFDKFLQYTVEVLAANNLPITALPRFLTNPKYRKKLLSRVTDPDLKRMFQDELDAINANDRRLELVNSTVTRISILMRNPAILYSLGQLEMALDFRHLMDEGVAVIHRMSGVRDHEARRMLAVLLMVGTEEAALGREDTQRPRVPHQLLVDEAGSFASRDRNGLNNLITQGRKYGLTTVLAHQHWAQLHPTQQQALQVTRVSVVFGVTPDDALETARRVGSFDLHAVKEEAPHERSHTIYQSPLEQTSIQSEFLKNLPEREALVRIGNAPPVHIVTPEVNVPDVPESEIDEIRQMYRRLYCKTAREITFAHHDPDDQEEDDDEPKVKSRL